MEVNEDKSSGTLAVNVEVGEDKSSGTLAVEVEVDEDKSSGTLASPAARWPSTWKSQR